ncbi:MAG: SDR family oxidoreductase [Planctomycetes bacterium]|nr:SDR family oxidoreductase [Planctomycetota bacterium]MCB9872032.1 SDR family oxidoreductase [Planctomycetota bacterium]MCB9888434.1 SDR family oxidoreductase [Planctomycetota bacterium]
MASSDDSGPGVALITGASRGIGLAIAADLVAAGFQVAITARDADRLAQARQALPPDAVVSSIAADLTEPDAPQRILEQVVATLGPPRVLVNNAGSAPSERFDKTVLADLDTALALHVRAPFLLLQAALPSLRAAPRSCAVQIASTAGLTGFPFTSAYTAAKHGMVGLCRALAAEFGSKPPRVYAVCPGFVDTEITRQAATEIAARGSKTFDEAMEALGGMNRIGRMHRPAEIAAAVLHLVREQPEGCVLDLDRKVPAFV